MPCLDENTIAALIEGRLSPEANAEVQRHVETCSSCRQLLAAVVRGDRATEDSRADTLPSARPAPPRQKGSQVGRYLVLEPIGAGGMGVVYSAYDPVLERRLALKLVRSETPSSSEVTERLLREGKSIAQLAHPNIVAVFDMGTAFGQVYVAMELVEGGSLKAWLKGKPRSWREVLDTFIAAGRGLAAAHQAGLVHRDFKPENVLVGNDGRVRVTDFGLASSTGALPERATGRPPLASPSERLTHDGALLGTPAYMSPEQLEGRAADALSDQFSFCVALYEGLYGTRPWAATSEPWQWKLASPPADSKVPQWVRRAVERGLSREPQARFPDLPALLDALGSDPDRARARRRRRLGIAAAGLAVLGASTWWAATRADRLCTGGPGRVAAVWNPATASKLQAAFEASGFDAAKASWQLSKAALDAYWSGWAAMHTEACRATRVLGEQSDQLLGLRMSCLDRRYSEGVALLEVLARGERDVVAKAPEAVDALVPLQRCADAEVLLAQVNGRDEPQVRALLDDGKARFDTGNYPEALARAADAVKLAAQLQDKPSLAESLLLRARLEEHLGKLKEAEGTLTDAISTAQAGKNDAVTAQAATALARVLGSRQARYAEAHAWLKLAEGSIGRIGGSPALQSQLRQTEGLVHYAEGRLSEAITAHQAAVALLQTLEPASLNLAEALNQLGNALRGGRRAKEAFAAFERALAILEQKVGPDSDLVAATRNGMANASMLEGRFDEALASYQQALDVFVKRLGPTHFRTVTTMNNVGVVLAEQGRYADALPWFQKVLDARVKTLAPTDAKTADAHANVGMLLVELGRDAEALQHFDQARGILQGYPLDHFSQAEALLGVAKVHLLRREGVKAVEPLQRVLGLCEKKEGFRFDYTRARASFLMGRALAEGSGKVDEGRALALASREALVGFGPERFRRDIGEVDAWLAAHPAK